MIGLCFSLVGSRVVLPGQLINPYIHTQRESEKPIPSKMPAPFWGKILVVCFLPHVQIEF